MSEEQQASARLTHRSRARVNTAPVTDINNLRLLPGGLGDLFGSIGDAVNAVSPLALEYWSRAYPDDGYENVWAVGLQGGLKASKIKELSNSPNGGRIRNLLGDFLPGFSVGAYVALGENDDVTRFSFEITSPAAITEFFGGGRAQQVINQKRALRSYQLSILGGNLHPPSQYLEDI